MRHMVLVLIVMVWGIKQIIDPDAIMPNKNISIAAGGIVTMGDDTEGCTTKN